MSLYTTEREGGIPPPPKKTGPHPLRDQEAPTPLRKNVTVVNARRFVACICIYQLIMHLMHVLFTRVFGVATH